MRDGAEVKELECAPRAGLKDADFKKTPNGERGIKTGYNVVENHTQPRFFAVKKFGRVGLKNVVNTKSNKGHHDRGPAGQNKAFCPC
jgi:hypothetical protein